ncbi:hypothetical protein GP486_006685, partial [Trichoglossum hirsutum]
MKRRLQTNERPTHGRLAFAGRGHGTSRLCVFVLSVFAALSLRSAGWSFEDEGGGIAAAIAIAAMAQSLPTYEEATSRDHWRLLVHTLDLSSLAHHRGEPDADKLLELLEEQWLRQLLHGTPKLQSLILRHCPIATHLALVSATSVGQTELHLLNASFCSKATAKSLRGGLAHFPALGYLDLSSTKSAGAWEAINQICSLNRLRILKLRDVGLQDAQMEALARAMGTRVWSLDVRNNNLSDMCIDTLLRCCFLSPNHGFNRPRESQASLITQQTATENAQNRQTRAPSNLRFAQAQGATNPPPSFSDIVHGGPNELEGDSDSEAYMVTYLASDPHAHIELFERPKTGLTHLYVAGNGFTVGSVARLLRTARLKSFDCGTLRTKYIPTQFGPPPTIKDLIPELANSKLTYLRIDHRIFGGDGRPRSSITTPHDWPGNIDISDEPNLVPAALPNLQHLVLTDVPTTIDQERFTDALKRFLHRLADQEREIARKEAAGAAVWASLPASFRAARRRERDRNSRTRGGLQCLDLELVSRDRRGKFSELWRSVTEDTDGEAFQRASANDYSFFADPEYGTDGPPLESPGGVETLRQQIMDLDMGSDNDLSFSSRPSTTTTTTTTAEQPYDPTEDVEMTSPISPSLSYGNAASGGDIKEIIAEFRRERRERFEEEV